MVAKFKYSRWARIYSTDEQSITDKIWDMTKKEKNKTNKTNKEQKQKQKQKQKANRFLNSKAILETEPSAIKSYQCWL